MFLNFLECCGLAELHGVGAASSDEILGHILEAQEERVGEVIATSVGSQRSTPGKLETAGFVKIKTFKNPNTGHMVTMWSRSTKMSKEEKILADAYLDESEHRGSRW